MTISTTERKIRATLPILRSVQTLIPLPAAQWLLKIGRARVRLGAGVIREAVTADGVPCEWILAHHSPTAPVLLYLHGGGFVFGLTPPHLQMGAHLAKEMGLRVLMVDYRTAPDHPFPAALDDCERAYLWLLNQGISARNLVVAGDSAGGNLTLALLMKVRDGGHPLPAAAACLSPVTDLTPQANRSRGSKDPLLSPQAVKVYNQSYVGNQDARNPLISPVFGHLRGLPPMLVHAGEDEILREDAVRISRLAEAHGVDVRLEVYPRMWHVWQLNLGLPQAFQSLDDIAHFLRSHLASDT